MQRIRTGEKTSGSLAERLAEVYYNPGYSEKDKLDAIVELALAQHREFAMWQAAMEDQLGELRQQVGRRSRYMEHESNASW